MKREVGNNIVEILKLLFLVVVLLLISVCFSRGECVNDICANNNFNDDELEWNRNVEEDLNNYEVCNIDGRCLIVDKSVNKIIISNTSIYEKYGCGFYRIRACDTEFLCGEWSNIVEVSNTMCLKMVNCRYEMRYSKTQWICDSCEEKCCESSVYRIPTNRCEEI